MMAQCFGGSYLWVVSQTVALWFGIIAPFGLGNEWLLPPLWALTGLSGCNEFLQLDCWGLNYIFLTDTSPLHFSFFWSSFVFHLTEVKRGCFRISERSHIPVKNLTSLVSHLWGNDSGGSVCILCVWTNRKKMTRQSNMIEEEQG